MWLRVILIPLGILTAIIVAITVYLAPNNLFSCGQTPSTIEGCEPVDAIVAVSGGDTKARTREAVNLYANGWAPKLIFSGAAKDKSGPSNAAAMKSDAVKMGVPADDIIIEEYGATTRENAENTKTIFDARSIDSVILVTSGYHQKRTSLEFEKRAAGVTVKSAPVSEDRQWSSTWWTTPAGWWLAVGELVKITLFYMGIS